MKIAIIGGGAAGASLVDRLANKPLPPQKKLDITIYEPSGQVGPGQAYRPDSPVLLVNRQAANMSLRNNEPDHFCKWLKKEVPESQNADTDLYVPRATFGRYLNDCFKQAATLLAGKGSSVKVEKALATDVKPANSGWKVLSENGKANLFEKVVFCLGTGRAKNPYGIKASKTYIDDPYPVAQTLKHIKANDRVLILGTGLSSIDVVRELQSKPDYKGTITLASRRAMLPSVRSSDMPENPIWFTPEQISKTIREKGTLELEDVLKLAQKEFAARGINLDRLQKEILDLKDPASRLKKQISIHEKQNSLEPLLNKMALDTTELIWQNLSFKDKKRYLKEFHPLFNSLRNPMPPFVAKNLLKAMDKGQITVLRGIRNVEQAENGKYTATFEDGSQRVFDCLVNTVKTPSANATSNPLLRQLIKNGIGVANPFGGVKTDIASNRLISPQNFPHSDLYALGEITQGDRYYTSSLFMINKRAQVIADELANESKALKAKL